MKDKNIQVYVHELQIGTSIGNDYVDPFVVRFNYVSWLWSEVHKEGIGNERYNEFMDAHFEAKYNLEQGLPIHFIPEYYKSR